MTDITIAGLAAELFVLDPPSTSTGVRYQFRLVTPDREFFTHEVAITGTAFVAEKGYSQDADACLEDAQRVVEELVAAGRFEDLVVTRDSTRWHEAKPALAPLKKHSSRYAID